MKIEVKAEDDEGNLVFEGKLNKKEVSYLLQFGINGLMAMGATFGFEKEDTGEVRINFSGENTVQ